MALNHKRSWPVICAVLAAFALIGSSGSQAVSGRTRFIESDRIVSTTSLDESDGEMCPFPVNPPLNISASLPQHARSSVAVAMLQQADAGAASTSEAQIRTRTGTFDRKPVRFIKDPNPGWSSIAVNAEHDMVVLTDENLFRIVEYSRLTNTPATGLMAVPRRVIGGDKTRAEMLCGVYIDPKTLEVYVTNNDTQNWLPVFSREARGNAVPDRVLATPITTWGIAADEIRQELFVTVQSSNAVIVYRKMAAGTEAPLRLLEGDATELADPHGIALDIKNDEMFIANHGHRQLTGRPEVLPPSLTQDEWRRKWELAMGRPGTHGLVGFDGREGQERNRGTFGRFDLPSINVYPRGASGNTPPRRVIKGPRTQLNWPNHVAVHEERGEIFVANDADDSVLVFRTSARGDVAPIRVIKGPRTMLKNPTGLALDVKNGELWVASMGNYTATVFPVTASGDVSPRRVIRGGPSDTVGLMIGNPGAAAYDSKRQEILVPN
jgi:DNA-binding beta-propeller fold protein YncE